VYTYSTEQPPPHHDLVRDLSCLRVARWISAHGIDLLEMTRGKTTMRAKMLVTVSPAIHEASCYIMCNIMLFHTLQHHHTREHDTK
jgi:hypothetical protein